MSPTRRNIALVLAATFLGAIFARATDEPKRPDPFDDLLKEIGPAHPARAATETLLNVVPNNRANMTYRGVLNAAVSAVDSLRIARAAKPEIPLDIAVAVKAHHDAIDQVRLALDGCENDQLRWFILARAALPLIDTANQLAPENRSLAADLAGELLLGGLKARDQAFAKVAQPEEVAARNQTRARVLAGLDLLRGIENDWNSEFKNSQFLKDYELWMVEETKPRHAYPSLDLRSADATLGEKAPRFQIEEGLGNVPWPFALAEALKLGKVRAAWTGIGLKSSDPNAPQLFRPFMNITFEFQIAPPREMTIPITTTTVNCGASRVLSRDQKTNLMANLGENDALYQWFQEAKAEIEAFKIQPSAPAESLFNVCDLIQRADDQELGRIETTVGSKIEEQVKNGKLSREDAREALKFFREARNSMQARVLRDVSFPVVAPNQARHPNRELIALPPKTPLPVDLFVHMIDEWRAAEKQADKTARKSVLAWSEWAEAIRKIDLARASTDFRLIDRRFDEAAIALKPDLSGVRVHLALCLTIELPPEKRYTPEVRSLLMQCEKLGDERLKDMQVFLQERFKRDDRFVGKKIVLPLEKGSKSTSMEFVLIPADTFQMGSAKEDDKDAEADEIPRHPVGITKPFYLGKYEVTRGQYRKFVDETAGYDAGEGWLNPGFDQTDEHPVVNVSWNDAMKFVEWLNSKKDGYTYRLPTEAEWEYACRAGSATRFSFGDDEGKIISYGNSNLNGDGFTFTAPVGKFSPNPWGLYDMHGNVWEWCSDWYSDEYYKASRADDPQGPAEPASSRVYRGGGWYNNPRNCRSAYRFWDSPRFRSNVLGFRLAAVRSEQ